MIRVTNIFAGKTKPELSNLGFTLVETLVAISILTLVTVSYMTLAQKGLTQFSNSKEQVVAYYLANDAMEYIKSIRATDLANSNEILTSGSFFYDLLLDSSGADCDGSGASTRGCYVDTTTGAISLCSTAGCPPLQFNDTTKLYSYASGAASGYTRKVIVQTVGTEQVIVTVQVTWQAQSGTQLYEVSRSFYELLTTV